MQEADEFVCTGCGSEVYSFPPRDPPPVQCAYCNMLDEFVADPVEREAMRRRMMGDTTRCVSRPR